MHQSYEKNTDMKTKVDLVEDIINVIMKTYNEFPELSKYIDEMPVNFSGAHTTETCIENLKQYHNSLEEIVVEYSKTHIANSIKDDPAKTKRKGYPHYPPSEDIYYHGKEEQNINPADVSKNKTPNVKKGTTNEKGFKDDMSGDDLDVPGSELDDQQESVGSEDEENNYYSLGLDNHNDLEEDKG